MQFLAKPRASRMLSSNVATRYEAGLFNGKGELVAALGYDAKRTRRALFDILADKGLDILALSALPYEARATWEGGSWTLPDGWRVSWTGATEFQRACEIAQQAA